MRSRDRSENDCKLQIFVQGNRVVRRLRRRGCWRPYSRDATRHLAIDDPSRTGTSERQYPKRHNILTGICIIVFYQFVYFSIPRFFRQS